MSMICSPSNVNNVKVQATREKKNYLINFNYISYKLALFMDNLRGLRYLNNML